MAERRLPWALVAVLLGGCAFTDPGDGTHGLQVVGTLAYTATGRSEDSRVSVAVNKAGSAQPGATVKLTDIDTGEAFDLAAASSGAFTGTLGGFRRHLQLDVAVAGEHLRCRLEGPGRHTIAAPLPGAVLSTHDDLGVLWKTVDGLRAGEVDVALTGAKFQQTLVDDGGTFAVPGARLRAGNETLTVTRRTLVSPAGGTGDSTFAAEYSVAVDFQLN